jgi:hypothetical protein
MRPSGFGDFKHSEIFKAVCMKSNNFYELRNLTSRRVIGLAGVFIERGLTVSVIRRLGAASST